MVGDYLGVSRKMKAPKIVMDPFAPSGIKEFVQNGVDNHNIGVTGHSAYYPVGFYVMDADGSVLGGLMGQIWARWLHVGTLWVDERVRGRGHASRLMMAAERYALEKDAPIRFSRRSLSRRVRFTKSWVTEYSARSTII